MSSHSKMNYTVHSVLLKPIWQIDYISKKNGAVILIHNGTRVLAAPNAAAKPLIVWEIPARAKLMMEPSDVHSAGDALVVSGDAPMETNVHSLKLFLQENPVLTLRKQRRRWPFPLLFNAQWLHPCLCITSHWCQGLSRKKSVIKSPSKEHWVCTHLQYLHTSTGQTLTNSLNL